MIYARFGTESVPCTRRNSLVKSIKHYRQKGVVSRSLISIVIIVLITSLIIWLLSITQSKEQANIQTPVPIRVVVVEVESGQV